MSTLISQNISRQVSSDPSGDSVSHTDPAPSATPDNPVCLKHCVSRSIGSVNRDHDPSQIPLTSGSVSRPDIPGPSDRPEVRSSGPSVSVRRTDIARLTRLNF